MEIKNKTKECKYCRKEINYNSNDVFNKNYLFGYCEKCEERFNEDRSLIDVHCAECHENKKFKFEDIVFETEKALPTDRRFCSDKCKRIYLEKQEVENQKTKKTILYNKIQQLPKKYREIISDHLPKVKNLNENLYLYGECGTGKSVLLASIYKELARQGEDVHWLNSNELFIELYSRMNKDTAYDYITELKKDGKILFIDDIGSEKPNDYVRSIFYNLVNHYEENELRIYFSSNFSLDELTERLDGRVASRIKGMCRTIKLTGEDRRNKKG